MLLQDGKNIVYGSRALATAQQNYAQIEKEAIAISYGSVKFNLYVFEKELLVGILQSIFLKLLYRAPPSLQRILLALQKYDVKVIYKPGKEMYISDSLNTSYLKETMKISILKMKS